MTATERKADAAAPHKLRAYILVNGILTNPAEAEGWTDRGVTWLNLRTSGKAEKFEYACGALTRRLRQQWRAEAIAKMARYYLRAGFEVTLIGHSNGCDLIARVLRLLAGERVASVHLFAAAADWEDFSAALANGTLGQAFVYVGGADRALALGAWTRRLFGWIKPGGRPLGYGSLGRTGPDPVPEDISPRVLTFVEPDYGHSTWLERGDRFEATLRLVLENETTPLK